MSVAGAREDRLSSGEWIHRGIIVVGRDGPVDVVRLASYIAYCLECQCLTILQRIGWIGNYDDAYVLRRGGYGERSRGIGYSSDCRGDRTRAVAGHVKCVDLYWRSGAHRRASEVR